MSIPHVALVLRAHELRAEIAALQRDVLMKLGALREIEQLVSKASEGDS
jgi:hypothetical protein